MGLQVGSKYCSVELHCLGDTYFDGFFIGLNNVKIVAYSTANFLYLFLFEGAKNVSIIVIADLYDPLRVLDLGRCSPFTICGDVFNYVAETLQKNAYIIPSITQFACFTK